MSTGFSVGWTSGSHITFDVIWVDDHQQTAPEAFVSRYQAPNAGSGPYFKARGDVVVKDQFGDIHRTRLVDSWYSGGRLNKFEITGSGNSRTCDWITQEGDRVIAGTRYIQYVTPVSAGKWHVRQEYYNWITWTWAFSYANDWDSRGEKWTEVALPLPDYSAYYNGFILANHMPWSQREYATAYATVAASLPQSSVNLMCNIKEAYDRICGLVRVLQNPLAGLAELGKTVSDPRDVWLHYRYVYSTNMSDLQEFTELVTALNELACNADGVFSLTGSYTREDGDTFGVSATFKCSDFLPKDVVSGLKQFGLRVTATNMWDIVPFSFMVDWFLGVGDQLAYFENWSNALTLSPQELWFTYRHHHDGLTIYQRTRGYVPNVLPIYQNASASGKTVLMRIADTVSIFT